MEVRVPPQKLVGCRGRSAREGHREHEARAEPTCRSDSSQSAASGRGALSHEGLGVHPGVYTGDDVSRKTRLPTRCRERCRITYRSDGALLAVCASSAALAFSECIQAADPLVVEAQVFYENRDYAADL